MLPTRVQVRPARALLPPWWGLLPPPRAVLEGLMALGFDDAAPTLGALRLCRAFVTVTPGPQFCSRSALVSNHCSPRALGNDGESRLTDAPR